MKLVLRTALALSACATVAVAQEIQPVWVQHHNGLVNVTPANKLPALQRRLSTTGDAAYGPLITGDRNDYGRLTIKGFANFLKYDDDHYLLGIRENGIDEVTETDPASVAAAAACPDKSVVWIDAHTGALLGVALQFPKFDTVNAVQDLPDFYWKWGIDEGAHGSRVIYSTYRYKIMRYAATGTVVDPNFPGGRATWSTTGTEAWVEPVPGEPNPTYPPLAKFIPSVNYSGNSAGVNWQALPGLPAPTSPADPNYAAYLDSSGGDGSASWRWKSFRVSGSGSTTTLWAGGGTWRASQLSRELVTDDGGLTFYPVSRLNDRGDGWGAKGNYSLGGQPSQIRTEPDGRRWCIQGHFPGSGWGARPFRYTLNPAAADDVGHTNITKCSADAPSGSVDVGYDANDAGTNHKERSHFYDPDGRAVGTLPAFAWEAAGQNGVPGPIRPQDGVDKYDGNWGMTADTEDGLDYIVSYSIPSWNQQFGPADNPTSTFTPGWLGIHTLDGKIAPGAANAWKLPCYETDERVVDPNGNGGTGFDYGYDGDVQIYADPTAPAASGKSLVLASFGEYGFGVFQVTNAPAQGTFVGPTPVAVLETHPLTLSAVFQGTGSPLLYKWQKDDGTGTFVDVPGARGNLSTYGSSVYQGSYTVNLAKVSDSGTYRIVLVNPYGNINSASATVVVNQDNVPPTVVSAGSVTGGDLTVCFDELVDAGGADTCVDPGTARNTANYSIVSPGGVNVTKATLGPDGRSVRLTVTGLSSTPGTAFSLKVANVRDYTRRAANAIPAAGQTVPGTVQTTFTTITDILGNPTFATGLMYSCGPGEFEVESGGQDIWGGSDNFHFAYKEVTGDFDVRVQVESENLSLPGNRNGIMLRETTADTSRFNYITWNPGGNGQMAFHVRELDATEPVWRNPENTWLTGFPPPNVWLRLQRLGSVTSAFRSTDGINWTAFGTTTNVIADPALLGLATCNGGNTTVLGYTKYAHYGNVGVLNLSSAGGVVTLSWTGGGVLKTSTSVTGPYTTAANQNNPQVVSPSDAARFYKLE